MTTEISISTPAESDDEKQARLRAEREKLEGMMFGGAAAEGEADATAAANDAAQVPDQEAEDAEDRVRNRQNSAVSGGVVE